MKNYIINKIGNSTAGLMLALILSIFSGLYGPSWLIDIAINLGEVFIKFLKLISMPILFLAIATSFFNINNFSNIKSLSRKILYYTLLTTISAAIVAFGLYLLIDPLSGIVNINIDLIGGASGAAKLANANYLSTFINMFPENIIKAFYDNNALGIALIGLFVGLSLQRMPEQKAKHLFLTLDSLFEVVKNIANYVIMLLPLGVWGFGTILLHNLQANNIDMNIIKNFVFCIVLANIIQGFIILPLFLFFNKISIIKLFKQVYPALTTAFFSKSSSATLPLTIKSLSKNDQEHEEFYNFSLPLCTIINMNGCAAFIYTAIIFNASYYGMHFSLFDMLLWVGIATLVAVGNASVPMGCYFLSSALLAGMGVPLKLMALILPIYTILDMLETAVNVWSDCIVTKIVRKNIYSTETASTEVRESATA